MEKPMNICLRRLTELKYSNVLIEKLTGGFAAEIYKIRANGQQGTLNRLIYKQFDPSRANELKVYGTLYPFIKRFMPTLHAMYRNPPQALLMDDAGSSIKNMLGEDSEEIQALIHLVLDTLATLHCESVNHIDEWMANGLVEGYPFGTEWADWAIQQLNRLERHAWDWYDPSWLEKLPELLQHFYNQYPESIRCKPTLTHGDPHADNIFMLNGRPVFIDWEWTVAASPLRDLTVFLQDLYEPMLIQASADEFYRLLKQKGYPITRESFDNDYRWTCLDNTVMMLAWEIEKFEMGVLTEKELRKMVCFKLQTIFKMWNEIVAAG